jgi:hypothetical protein
LIPERQLQAEGNRLGVHTMGAADHHGPLILEGLVPQHLHQILHVLEQNGRGLLELNGQGRVHDVGGSHTDMKEAGVVADGFRHATQERDDLVFNFALDFANPRNVEASLFFNPRDGRFRHLPQLS